MFLPVIVNGQVNQALVVVLPGACLPGDLSLTTVTSEAVARDCSCLAFTTLEQGFEGMSHYELRCRLDEKIIQGSQGMAGITFFRLFEGADDPQFLTVQKEYPKSGMLCMHGESAPNA